MLARVWCICVSVHTCIHAYVCGVYLCEHAYICTCMLACVWCLCMGVSVCKSIHGAHIRMYNHTDSIRTSTMALT